MSLSRAERIRSLNDQYRSTLNVERVVLTRGVLALPWEKVIRILNRVRFYDDFNADNDPFEEHDFGSFVLDGVKIFWKIDYYDLKIKYHSEDPADQTKTQRVLTIMLSSEW